MLAMPGQHVEIADTINIGQLAVPGSALRLVDGQGRKLQAFQGGIVPPGYFFLHSEYAGSYDSRYFGPIPDKGLLGLAQPILTLE